MKVRLVGICSEKCTGRYVRNQSGLIRRISGEFKGASQENIPFHTQTVNFIYSSFQLLREIAQLKLLLMN